MKTIKSSHVDFLKWAIDHYYTPYGNGDKMIWRTRGGAGTIVEDFTSEELYDKYKKEQYEITIRQKDHGFTIGAPIRFHEGKWEPCRIGEAVEAIVFEVASDSFKAMLPADEISSIEFPQ